MSKVLFYYRDLFNFPDRNEEEDVIWMARIAEKYQDRFDLETMFAVLLTAKNLSTKWGYSIEAIARVVHQIEDDFVPSSPNVILARTVFDGKMDPTEGSTVIQTSQDLLRDGVDLAMAKTHKTFTGKVDGEPKIFRMFESIIYR